MGVIKCLLYETCLPTFKVAGGRDRLKVVPRCRSNTTFFFGLKLLSTAAINKRDQYSFA
jgi:hypothetical protein